MTKRKALGKGLSALIPDVDHLEERKEHFFYCPLEAIEPNPYQPRQEFGAAEMEEMVNSVTEKGILTPLLVSKTESGYRLIAGERRWRAAQRAGLKHVPVIVREATPLESLELALIENIHRKDLNPIEEALAYRKLLEEAGATQESLAKTLGRDRTSVTNLLRLLKLPFSIQKDLIDGRLSMGHARVLVGLQNPEDQKALRDLIIRKALSVRQTELLAATKKPTIPPRKRGGDTDHYLHSQAETLKRALGTKVEIKKKGNQGRLIIHFYSDDELDRLLERLG